MLPNRRPARREHPITFVPCRRSSSPGRATQSDRPPSVGTSGLKLRVKAASACSPTSESRVITTGCGRLAPPSPPPSAGGWRPRAGEHASGPTSRIRSLSTPPPGPRPLHAVNRRVSVDRNGPPRPHRHMLSVRPCSRAVFEWPISRVTSVPSDVRGTLRAPRIEVRLGSRSDRDPEVRLPRRSPRPAGLARTTPGMGADCASTTATRDGRGSARGRTPVPGPSTTFSTGGDDAPLRRRAAPRPPFERRI